jgi:acyl-CoA reductase-like NAD-dependent aldehyde dehydrogenase
MTAELTEERRATLRGLCEASTLGDPFAPETALGPLVSDVQRERRELGRFALEEFLQVKAMQR